MVYIDFPVVHPRTKAWPYGEACHLYVTADTDIDVLHTFAIKIGMRVTWFQDHSSIPHYDLTKTRRALAIKSGAVEREITLSDFREWRARRKEQGHDA